MDFVITYVIVNEFLYYTCLSQQVSFELYIFQLILKLSVSLLLVQSLLS